MVLVYLFFGNNIMNLKSLLALTFFLISNYLTYGQDENYYVSDNNDTIKIANNIAYFRIGNDTINTSTFIGKG